MPGMPMPPMMKAKPKMKPGRPKGSGKKAASKMAPPTAQPNPFADMKKSLKDMK